jgi:hypothetical protein
MRSILDAADRRELVTRLRRLRPDSKPRWGRMSGPQMIVHLGDQMRHTLGEVPVVARPGPLRWPVVKQLVLYLLPWPKGKVKGPSEAFATAPWDWERDLGTLEALVGRFADAPDRPSWPDHALFGSMSRAGWGYFCHRHFDHHLRQFGV